MPFFCIKDFYLGGKASIISTVETALGVVGEGEEERRGRVMIGGDVAALWLLSLASSSS